ncbi:MAG: hypothetical protein ABW049_10645 [Spongiibacteraceae bacterium]
MAWRLVSVWLALSLLSACTPEHAVKTGEDLAARSRLTDSVVIRRSTQRVLSRQAQICLVSNKADTEAGLALLRNMQAALSGYFLAVGVESQALDYAVALQRLPCPGANYLFFVQPLETPCKTGADSCDNGKLTDLMITVLNAHNGGLADRMTLTLKRNWLSLATDAQADQRAAFEELARALTGELP